MQKILVSACLFGQPVRYDGSHCFQKHFLWKRWLEEDRLLPICPEVIGGLSTPRPPAEWLEGDGTSVVMGHAARLISIDGDDVLPHFQRGADKTLAFAKAHNIAIAILKSKSPSCGFGRIYDGSFSGMLIDGDGLTAARLKNIGVQIYNEHQLEEAQSALEKLEPTEKT
ncbi:DUF523 domain-containing protein [Pokkaliibacter sp. CJK22405]|uniref:DUF523 domain-containing protein n=1 Tax=Pokkaliibacter sp. CJK22405 TaxID=3384615 RepID=UPI0039849239